MTDAATLEVLAALQIAMSGCTVAAVESARGHLHGVSFILEGEDPRTIALYVTTERKLCVEIDGKPGAAFLRQRRSAE